MCALNINETRDKSLLANLFNSDRPLYAYLLGDLDDFFFINTRWWIAQSDETSNLESQASLLEYNAFSTPDLIGLSENQAQADIWKLVLKDLPAVAHVHYRKLHEELIYSAGVVKPIGTHFRMLWDSKAVSDDITEIDLSEVKRLVPEDIGSIRELHDSSSESAYFDERLLHTGLCFGIWRGQTLAAFSGCHVHSKEYGVAALGAITTHKDHRGQGLGTRVTQSLLKQLRDDISCITLNVHSENLAAIKIYKRLGFVVYCEYEEAILSNSK